MFHRLQTLTVDCDAPAYPIVQACQAVGIEEPADVRWCRLAHLEHEHNRRLELFRPRTWKALLGLTESQHGHCFCGQQLPRLDKCTFTLLSGKELHYFLGQCKRCRTVFWEQA